MPEQFPLPTLQASAPCDVSPHGSPCCVRLSPGSSLHDGVEFTAGVTYAEPSLLVHLEGGRPYEVVRDGVRWRFRAAAGTVDYYPGGAYALVRSGPGLLRSLRITVPRALESAVLQGHSGADGPLPAFGLRDPRLLTLARQLRSCAEGEADARAWPLLSVALLDCLHGLLQTGPRGPSTAPGFGPAMHAAVQRMIEEHLGAPDELARLPQLCGLARAAWARSFRASFGLTFHQYVIERRIAAATQRLQQDVRVTELSQELGFASHAHFSTVFRARTGRTPTEFRRTCAPGAAEPTSSRATSEAAGA